MFTASFLSRQAAAPHPGRPQPNGWFRVQHSWILGVAALQSACSLLIEVDDGLDGEVEVEHSQGGSTSEGPDASASDATAGSSGSGGAGGSTAVGGSSGSGGAAGSGASEPDAGVPEPDGGDAGSEKQPIFDLAFIEDPEEADATLRLVNSSLASSSEPSNGEPPWRISLHPDNQVGGVLDFAWSPDGERIAVRYVGLNGPRLAFFAAPEWDEIAVEAAPSAGEPVDLDATANYRWSPSSDAVAVELSGGQQPLVGAYGIEAGAAFELEPVAFEGRIETMD